MPEHYLSLTKFANNFAQESGQKISCGKNKFGCYFGFTNGFLWFLIPIMELYRWVCIRGNKLFNLEGGSMGLKAVARGILRLGEKRWCILKIGPSNRFILSFKVCIERV